MYTIYLLTFPNGKKYCGYTSRSVKSRWRNGTGYDKCPLINSAIIKYGWDNVTKEIIFTTENQDEAYAYEKETISNLNLTNPKYGYNLDEGGRPHGSATHLTETGRKKISEANKARWADPERRQKYIEIQKKHPPTRECIEKGVAASAAARKGKPAYNAKPVNQYDVDTDVLIATFPSATAASLALTHDATGCSNILNVCKGKRKTAYGYKWRFVLCE